MISSAPPEVNNDPVVSGIVADVYEGTIEGTKVRVKKVRTYARDDPEKIKVLCPSLFSFPTF
jgi:hypothetical protein